MLCSQWSPSSSMITFFIDLYTEHVSSTDTRRGAYSTDTPVHRRTKVCDDERKTSEEIMWCHDLRETMHMHIPPLSTPERTEQLCDLIYTLLLPYYHVTCRIEQTYRSAWAFQETGWERRNPFSTMQPRLSRFGKLVSLPGGYCVTRIK